MNNQFSRVAKVIFALSFIISSAVPNQSSSAFPAEIELISPSTATSDLAFYEPETLIMPPQELEAIPETKISTPEYKVVQNADPYIMSLALGNEEKISQYGPDRNIPEEGIPKHAYSPFDDLEKREVCPPGGCDYVEGRVLIKFEPEQTFSLNMSNEITFQDEALESTLDSLEITKLKPIFPGAEKPAIGEMIETIDGDLLPKPDLTRWFQAETLSEKGLGEVIQQLKNTAGIEVAEPDFVRKPIGEVIDSISLSENPILAPLSTLPGSTSDPLYDQQWHLGATHVPEAWAYLDSQGLPPGGSRDIVVAVIDTGVDYMHPDLAANIWVNPAEFNGIPGVDDDRNGYVDDIHGADTVYPDGNPMDDHGHGTHVAGIIAAQANNGIGGVGVAYNVQVMPIKAAQYSGVLASSDIAEAIYYAVSKGADVINMSFGGYARTTVEYDALAVAFGQAVLVAAAGNDGNVNLPCPFGADMFPAAYNWVLGVMASNTTNSLASFSNTDCVPHDTHEYELMAPGVSVWSALPNGQFAAWSGTSMSAPLVSGIAALARTKWSDKDMYSSRFIMGQIASNTSQPIGGVVNVFNALTIPPRPELSYLEHWLFDTPDINSINDNDGIVDTGETIDLAILIRNHWGKADPVIVNLEAWAQGAIFPDPYVTMITDTISYGAVGSFNHDDNGLVYDDNGSVIGIQNPFRFTISNTTPNNHLIPLRLTITAGNGYDPDDPQSPYTFQSWFYLVVQRGFELPNIISEDMILTKDFFWIIPAPTLIEAGATVTITEGIQLQFDAPDPDDPYTNPPPPAELNIEGKLIIQGTADEPVEIFPYPYHPVWDAWGLGRVNILGLNQTESSFIGYARFQNPMIYGNIIIDHSDFTTIDGVVTTLNANNLQYSIFRNLGRYGSGWIVQSPVSFSLFEKSGAYVSTGNLSVENNVFLFNRDAFANIGYIAPDDTSEEVGRANNNFRKNAILHRWWDPNISQLVRIEGPPIGYSRFIPDNYWQTISSTVINATIYDCKDYYQKGCVYYTPLLSETLETLYPYVVDIQISTQDQPQTKVVGAETVTFTVSFNRDMDISVLPHVSFGPDIPMTDYTVHPIDGGWIDARTWVGTFNVNPITGDGYQLIRVAGAVAADDPWLVTGDDAGRFRFEIITSGTEAMNLQATGGEGYVDLMWTQTDFDLLAGFNLYRSTTLDGVYSRINPSIIPPDVRTYRDTNVIPGQPYFYKFTVVKSDMTESDFSNIATATPLDTIPPVLTHTPITSAEPGQPLTLNATATDNVAVSSVVLFYRHVEDTLYASTAMVRTTGDSYFATIEGSLLTSPGIEYYIEASDGISITRNGRAEDPNLVTVIDRPVVTIVTPNSGPSTGGTSVTVSGSNFKDGANVSFGGMSASTVVFVSSNQITCITPAHIPATVDVRVTNPDDQYGLLLNGFTFFSTATQVSLPNTGGGTGNVVTVPVNAANINGMLAASFTVNFDPSVLSVKSTSTGTLTSGWAFASNLLAPGQYRLSMSSTSGVSGTGTLAALEFEVIGLPGSSSTLSISNILLNDGAITVELTNGLFNVDNVYNVSGLVSYWSGGAPVPGTNLALTGDTVYNALSGLDGNFTIQGADVDAYVLNPSKSDGDNGITAFDASYALQHDVGLITLSGNQAIAADVNSNGSITSMDAAYILQKAAGLITLPFPGSGVAWKFSPPSRDIAELTSNLTGQNFTAILLGDISGNWTDIGESTVAVTNEINAASAILTIPVVNALPGESIEIPISLEINDAELLGADIIFTHDPAHVSISNVKVGSLATNWSLVSNLSEPGVVRIAMAGATPITTDGELVLCTVTALGTQGSLSLLSLVEGILNEGAIPSTLDSGSIFVGGLQEIFLPVIVR